MAKGVVGFFPTNLLYQPRPFVSFQGGITEFSLQMTFRRTFQTGLSIRIEDPILGGLIQRESSFIIHSISPSYALGIFQTKPFTAEEMGMINPFYPYGGVRVLEYVESLERQFGSKDLALAAYHMGTGTVTKIVQSGKDPLSETPARDYVHQIKEFSRQYANGSRVGLRDYIWVSVQGDVRTGEPDSFRFISVFPTFWFGSTAIGIDVGQRTFPFFYQEWFIHPKVQLVCGYNDEWISGIQVRSNTWNQTLSLVFSSDSEQLSWEFSSVCQPWMLLIRMRQEDWRFQLGYEVHKGFEVYAGIRCRDRWIPYLGILIRF